MFSGTTIITVAIAQSRRTTEARRGEIKEHRPSEIDYEHSKVFLPLSNLLVGFQTLNILQDWLLRRQKPAFPLKNHCKSSSHETLFKTVYLCLSFWIYFSLPNLSQPFCTVFALASFPTFFGSTTMSLILPATDSWVCCSRMRFNRWEVECRGRRVWH